MSSENGGWGLMIDSKFTSKFTSAYLALRNGANIQVSFRFLLRLLIHLPLQVSYWRTNFGLIWITSRYKFNISHIYRFLYIFSDFGSRFLHRVFGNLSEFGYVSKLWFNTTLFFHRYPLHRYVINILVFSFHTNGNLRLGFTIIFSIRFHYTGTLCDRLGCPTLCYRITYTKLPIPARDSPRQNSQSTIPFGLLANYARFNWWGRNWGGVRCGCEICVSCVGLSSSGISCELLIVVHWPPSKAVIFYCRALVVILDKTTLPKSRRNLFFDVKKIESYNKRRPTVATNQGSQWCPLYEKIWVVIKNIPCAFDNILLAETLGHL